MKATYRYNDIVWTVEYNVLSPIEVEIIRFSNDDPEGYEKEKELPQCCVVENEVRTFVVLQIRDNYEPFTWCSALNCNHEYKVVNPKYILNYK